MPQMAPIYWLMMMMYFTLMMLILIMFIIFFIFPQKYLMKTNFNNSMNWMW